MASATKILKARRRMKESNAGRARKNDLARHGTTPSQAELFGDKQETRHYKEIIAELKQKAS